MKTREGFVSNSSTTSFIVYGASFSGNAREIGNKIEEALYDKDKPESWKGIDVHFGQECYSVYVGRDWKRIPDDETAKAFKERTEKDVREVLEKAGVSADKLHFGIHEESWYDG
jgi:hypothetical protein